MVEGDRSSGAVAGVNRRLEWRCYCCDLCCAIRVSVTDGLVVCTGVDLSRGSDVLNEFWFCRILLIMSWQTLKSVFLVEK